MNRFFPFAATLFVSLAAVAGPLKTVDEFQKRALAYNEIISLPQFETTPAEVTAAAAKAIAAGNAALDVVGKLDPKTVTFQNTIQALDYLDYVAGGTGNRLEIIKNASPSAAMRNAATDALDKLDDWSVSVNYRQDVYNAVKAYAETNPKLEGEDARLFDQTLRDYRRAGLDLPKDQQKQIEDLFQQLSKLETDFSNNIRDTHSLVHFTKAQLAGVPADLFEEKGVKIGRDDYAIDANVTFQVIAVMDNCSVEETRKKMNIARESRTMEKNVPLMGKIVGIRDTLAQKLHYASWADYRIEPMMAKNAETATKFLTDLYKGLQPKFEAENVELRRLKAAETGDPNAQIHVWDWRYYSEKLHQQKFHIDEEALRVYFPYQNVLQGMFDCYQTIFGIKIEQIAAPYKWVDDLRLYAVSDAKTNEPLGLFYLDMFPREGKYNHFAQFGIIEGVRLPDGRYQRPTVALICNFPPPTPGKPSLMTQEDVVTIFHEFGHGMHSILTRANYGRFAGTNVPRDFVEAPSQMLEYWGWDKGVLDSFAADYRDPSKKIPSEILDQLKNSETATIGNSYRRQLSFALLDLAIHGPPLPGGAKKDVVKISNDIMTRVFYPVEPGTATIASFDHLAGGYDAGYYGYAWADAIAADMATVFQKAPKRFFDPDAGMRLRDEIYSRGDSRDVNISIEKFLGRPRSIEPFLEKLGIK
jgi:thimet oligopeptidase